MRSVQDALDLAISVVAMSVMLFVCVWSLDAIKASSEVPVIEKTAVHNVYGVEVVQPQQTAEDALMMLVVNDSFVPYPNRVEFLYGTNSTYTIVYNDAYFVDKEASINKAWTEFFYNKMDTVVESVQLSSDGSSWQIRLVR